MKKRGAGRGEAGGEPVKRRSKRKQGEELKDKNKEGEEEGERKVEGKEEL